MPEETLEEAARQRRSGAAPTPLLVSGRMSKWNWREIPAWAAVVVALLGISLTYWEIRTANEREILFRVWDDTWKLYHSTGDFPGNSSERRVSIEMGLLSGIHSHAGLLGDRSFVRAAWEVSRAWSSDHITAAESRYKTTDEIDKLITLLEERLGSFRPPDWPPKESPSTEAPCAYP